MSEKTKIKRTFSIRAFCHNCRRAISFDLPFGARWIDSRYITSDRPPFPPDLAHYIVKIDPPTYVCCPTCGSGDITAMDVVLELSEER